MANLAQVEPSRDISEHDSPLPFASQIQPSDPSSTSIIKPRRSGSVRFSEETQSPSTQSNMSPRDRADEIEETTPIRQASERQNRNYNTADSAPESREPSRPKSSSSTDGATPSPSGEKTSWYKRLAEKYGAVSLDNKGSVARDHLALERTFLAWLRTSLAFASIGIAVTQLFRLNVSIQSKSQVVPTQNLQLPFSPLLGHGLPEDLVPFLQQMAATSSSSMQTPKLGSTLLDQLLLLPEHGTDPSIGGGVLRSLAFDEDAAAKLRHAGKPLGATFLGISIIVLLVGFHRYFEAQYWIMRGKFPASRGGIALIGMIAGALIIASLVTVLVVAPGSYQKK